METIEKKQLEKDLEKGLIKLNRKYKKVERVLIDLNGAIDNLWDVVELLLNKDIVDSKNRL